MSSATPSVQLRNLFKDFNTEILSKFTTDQVAVFKRESFDLEKLCATVLRLYAEAEKNKKVKEFKDAVQTYILFFHERGFGHKNTHMMTAAAKASYEQALVELPLADKAQKSPESLTPSRFCAVFGKYMIMLDLIENSRSPLPDSSDPNFPFLSLPKILASPYWYCVRSYMATYFPLHCDIFDEANFACTYTAYQITNPNMPDMCQVQRSFWRLSHQTPYPLLTEDEKRDALLTAGLLREYKGDCQVQRRALVNAWLPLLYSCNVMQRDPEIFARTLECVNDWGSFIDVEVKKAAEKAHNKWPLIASENTPYYEVDGIKKSVDNQNDLWKRLLPKSPRPEDVYGDLQRGDVGSGMGGGGGGGGGGGSGGKGGESDHEEQHDESDHGGGGGNESQHEEEDEFEREMRELEERRRQLEERRRTTQSRGGRGGGGRGRGRGQGFRIGGQESEGRTPDERLRELQSLRHQAIQDFGNSGGVKIPSMNAHTWGLLHLKSRNLSNQGLAVLMVCAYSIRDDSITRGLMAYAKALNDAERFGADIKEIEERLLDSLAKVISQIDETKLPEKAQEVFRTEALRGLEAKKLQERMEAAQQKIAEQQKEKEREEEEKDEESRTGETDAEKEKGKSGESIDMPEIQRFKDAEKERQQKELEEFERNVKELERKAKEGEQIFAEKPKTGKPQSETPQPEKHSATSFGGRFASKSEPKLKPLKGDEEQPKKDPSFSEVVKGERLKSEHTQENTDESSDESEEEFTSAVVSPNDSAESDATTRDEEQPTQQSPSVNGTPVSTPVNYAQISYANRLTEFEKELYKTLKVSEGGILLKQDLLKTMSSTLSELKAAGVDCTYAETLLRKLESRDSSNKESKHFTEGEATDKIIFQVSGEAKNEGDVGDLRVYLQRSDELVETGVFLPKYRWAFYRNMKIETPPVHKNYVPSNRIRHECEAFGNTELGINTAVPSCLFNACKDRGFQPFRDLIINVNTADTAKRNAWLQKQQPGLQSFLRTIVNCAAVHTYAMMAAGAFGGLYHDGNRKAYNQCWSEALLKIEASANIKDGMAKVRKAGGLLTEGGWLLLDEAIMVLISDMGTAKGTLFAKKNSFLPLIAEKYLPPEMPDEPEYLNCSSIFLDRKFAQFLLHCESLELSRLQMVSLSYRWWIKKAVQNVFFTDPMSARNLKAIESFVWYFPIEKGEVRFAYPSEPKSERTTSPTEEAYEEDQEEWK